MAECGWIVLVQGHNNCAVAANSAISFGKNDYVTERLLLSKMLFYILCLFVLLNAFLRLICNLRSGKLINITKIPRSQTIPMPRMLQTFNFKAIRPVC